MGIPMDTGMFIGMIAEILEKFGDFCWMFPKSSEISLIFVGRNGRKQYIYNVRPPVVS